MTADGKGWGMKERDMTRAAALVFVVLVPGVGFGQTAAPPPLPPGHGGQHMSSAAGVPLVDGALPPGMLTIRLVRGGFAEDLAGQDVAVDVLGGKTETARTGPDGRAAIAHLPVGVQLRASAVVAGERLESELFDMPPDSGVRLLLVAGGLPAGHPSIEPSASFPDPGRLPGPPDPRPREQAAGPGDTGTLMAATLAVAAVAFAAVILRRRWWLSTSPAGDRPEQGSGG